ncbi:lipoate--protein ligase family protein [Nocardioides guangzhouensis]|uniref:Lipoate--protein ligase family protein n=1 Tax=Nocardioides guangzhouensis TaxID=2497878 RepID=A0A4V1XYQ2_9ACTN|nr:lipoate--protein ligase family protein [Nocardioides guangzhouensis]RYP84039.1 lipoate--protein ligase family protein [Nocardioides guangzhouensis]
MASPLLVLAEPAHPGGPVHDVALPTVLLRQRLPDGDEVLRVYSPDPTAAFTRRDTRRPGYDAAVALARSSGFSPVVRPQGGRVAAYHGGSVVIDHVLRTDRPHDGLVDRFRRFAELHAEVLRRLGVDARIGELPGEYCPGEFSVNAAGVHKLAGSAQRVTRDGWAFSTVVQVRGTDRLREVMDRVHDALGYPYAAATVGSVEDHVPGIAVDDVVSAMLEAYGGPHRVPLPAEVLEAVAEAP